LSPESLAALPVPVEEAAAVASSSQFWSAKEGTITYERCGKQWLLKGDVTRMRENEVCPIVYSYRESRVNTYVKSWNCWSVADSLIKLSGKFCAELRTSRRLVELFWGLEKIGETVSSLSLSEKPERCSISIMMTIPLHS